MTSACNGDNLLIPVKPDKVKLSMQIDPDLDFQPICNATPRTALIIQGDVSRQIGISTLVKVEILLRHFVYDMYLI